MSTRLYWRPTHQPGDTLPTALKYVVARKWWGHDGTLGSEPYTVSDKDRDFLEGVMAATQNDETRDGARRLLALVEQYGEVDVWLQS